MKKIISKFLFAIAMLVSVNSFGQNLPRINEKFDFDWKFHLGDSANGAAINLDDSQWRALDLPHDWSIELPFDPKAGGSMGYLPGGTGWYRKTFEIPQSYKGKKISILFDGIYHQSDVYINGKHLGFYPYGYIGFEYDLTPHLKYGGKNTIAVRVDHSDSPSSRWYSGSGIYRHVWLTVTDQVRVSTWGTYVTTPQITPERAEIKIVTTLENNSSAGKNISLENIILDVAGNRVATKTSSATVSGRKKTDVEQTLAVVDPSLWSPETPVLYTIRTVVKSDGAVIDNYETPFGIRYFKYDPDKGFFLNGKPLKMKGMNLHQDAGALGVAVPDRAYERRMEILKEYGCNAIRFSHNPPSPEMLDLCDRLGFLAIDEAFDKWKSGYYEKYFDQWWQTDLGSMLRRDRNHPSIVMWSIGNETTEQNDPGPAGAQRAKMLRDYVHATEPTRPVTAAIAPSDVSKRHYTKNGFIDALDIVGYNYMEPWFAEDKKQHPEWIMFGSEVFPFYRGREGSIRDYSPHNPWYDAAKNDFIFGYFIWAGIDYLGESSGWPSKGWPTSPFSTTMQEKSRGAFLRSVWKDEPAVSIAVADQSLNIDPGKDHWSWPHLISHWTFPQYRGHIIQVQTMTNCDEVELWINEKWFGRRKTADYTNNTIVWYVPYTDGKIFAKGFRAGREEAYFELKTAKDPAGIVLTPDRRSIKADGQDLSHVAVSIVDAEGTIVPGKDVEIVYEVTGNGRLAGLDNGDLKCSEPYKGTKRTTYFGQAQAIIQSTRMPGEIVMKARAEGLPEAVLTISSR